MSNLKQNNKARKPMVMNKMRGMWERLLNQVKKANRRNMAVMLVKRELQGRVMRMEQRPQISPNSLKKSLQPSQQPQLNLHTSPQRLGRIMCQWHSCHPYRCHMWRARRARRCLCLV